MTFMAIYLPLPPPSRGVQTATDHRPVTYMFFPPAVKLSDAPLRVDRSTATNTWHRTSLLHHVLLNKVEDVCSRLSVFIAVLINTTVLRIMTPCSGRYIPNFVGICCLNLRGRRLLSPGTNTHIYRIT